MRYKAVIFDLDGTLVDSLADLADSVNEMLRQYGYPEHPVLAYKRMVGNGACALIQRSLPGTPDDALINEALAKYKEIYGRQFLHKTRPYAGILELVGALQARGVKLAVCTNKYQSAAEVIIAKLFPRGAFDCVVGERAGAPRKPAPDAALAIARRLKVRPDEAVYIGDSMVDMQTGVNAKMLTVGVLWGFRERKELEENGGSIMLTQPAELLEKVEFVL